MLPSPSPLPLCHALQACPTSPSASNPPQPPLLRTHAHPAHPAHTVSTVGTMIVVYSASGSSGFDSMVSSQGTHLSRDLSNMKSYTWRRGATQRQRQQRRTGREVAGTAGMVLVLVRDGCREAVVGTCLPRQLGRAAPHRGTRGPPAPQALCCPSLQHPQLADGSAKHVLRTPKHFGPALPPGLVLSPACPPGSAR